MRGIGGVLAVSLTALLVICSADPDRGAKVSSSEHNVGVLSDGQDPLNLDQLGGGNLVREVRQLRNHGIVPLVPRLHYIGSPLGGGALLMRRQNNEDDNPKPNSDGKIQTNQTHYPIRNFDEIDRSDLPFPSNRRSYVIYGLRPLGGGALWMRRQNNEDDKPKPKETTYPDNSKSRGNFDEIDHTSMPFPDNRRSYDSYGLRPLGGGALWMRRQNNEDDKPKPKETTYPDNSKSRGNFDEIDHTSMPFPDNRRSYDSYGLRPLGGGALWMRRQNNEDDKPKPKETTYPDNSKSRGNFDEIDHTSMPFPDNRRSYDSYGLRPLGGGALWMRRQNNEDDKPKPKETTYPDNSKSRGNFDEIDHTSMPFPDNRRSYDSYGLRPYGGGALWMRRQNNEDDKPKPNSDGKDQSNQNRYPNRNFDEIDRTDLPFPHKRRSYDSYGLSPYGGGALWMRRQNNEDDKPKPNSDGKDQSNQNRYPNRNFDEIDRTDLPFPHKRRSYDSYSLLL